MGTGYYGASNPTKVSVNELKLPVLDFSVEWHDPEYPYPHHPMEAGGYHSLELVFERPEFAALLDLGAIVQIHLPDWKPSAFRVTAVREDGQRAHEHSGWPPRVYVVELSEVSSDQRSDQESGTVEVIYQTVFTAVAMRTQIEAIGQLLIEKGVITAQEYRDRLAARVRSSFLDYALDIVAEEEATALRDVILGKLDENLDAMMPQMDVEVRAKS